MKLAVIILNYNTSALLEDCLKSILEKKWQTEIGVWVVDNCSTDDSVKMVEKKFPEVKLIKNNTNAGFSAGNNLGLRKIKAENYLLLNSDTLVEENSLDNLENFAQRSEFGICSCKLIFKDGKFQPNAGELPTFWPLFVWVSGLDDVFLGVREFLPSFHRKFPIFFKGDREVGWVSGTAMLIKNKTLEKIGFLDENIFMYGEDVEYCLRAKRAGIRVGWTDSATIIHLGGGSSKDPSFRQWLGEIAGLRYIYKKYFGAFTLLLLNFLICFFYLLRALVFLILGKRKISGTYVKVLMGN